ncbi:MAG: DUF3300 domain-containing protein [Caulobacteraceae bacterium]|nr:DUF3300 domain-containing protein [Caulobacteraceae bacterium]
MKTVWAALFLTAIAMGSAAHGGQPDIESPPPASSPDAPPEGRLEQLVAPIALYPDALLGQILMAAAYPLEVVEAERWRRDPQNANLQPDALAAALQYQNWDPSVKSLTAWPEVLAMMDGQIEWTEALGEAFISDPGAVMDAVQRLRAKAYAANRLASDRMMTVSDDDGEIGIAPAEDSTLYAPTYDPDVVFGPWGWPDYPPFTFSGWYDDCAVGDLGWCWAAFPLSPLFWGWDSFDWRRHYLRVDNDRWGRGQDARGQNASGPGARGSDSGGPETRGQQAREPGARAPGASGPGASSRSAWVYNPDHRHGVPYQSPEGPPRLDARAIDAATQREARGLAAPERDDSGRAASERVGFERAGAERAGPGRAGPEEAGFQRAPERAPERPEVASRPPPTFESFGSGAEARAWAQRGFASRTSSFPAASFHGGGFSGGGFRGGGRAR